MAIVAIPVLNEAARIAACLRALDRQEGARLDRIVLLLNNCTDGTQAVVEALRPALATPIDLHSITLPPARAGAGHARRLAMQYAAALCPPDGLLLTTDADGAVAPDWLARTHAALRAGADVVCGRALIDPEEARLIPAQLHADDALESAYGTLLDEIHALVDPDPADPWPRHTEHSGASIALRREMFDRAGGVPDVPVGEDRALIAALRRHDAAIRHAPEVRVVVSGRTDGRARGGMGDTIRRRLVRQDPFVDDRLEPALNCLRRARARAALRAVWTARPAGARFGIVWEAFERQSPALRRLLVPRALVLEEAGQALRILDRLRPAVEEGKEECSFLKKRTKKLL